MYIRIIYIEYIVLLHKDTLTHLPYPNGVRARSKFRVPLLLQTLEKPVLACCTYCVSVYHIIYYHIRQFS